MKAKQSLRLLTPPGMPRYSDDLAEGNHYVWMLDKDQKEPRQRQRAIRVFDDRLEARQWAHNNLDYPFIASKA